ncbi:GNAT family N-acetyltransferase [Rhizobium cauense]|uniref:GNAT family N-acetyltransferase n=1 Tax=Rhizobium cauense TaxID=1166683 RepID=UPI001C6ED363|nr:GNAT family protein [Rhizobium cauense]MBW9112561.1 GNAT family N-acetyltransferase [Rhizobium cauense]
MLVSERHHDTALHLERQLLRNIVLLKQLSLFPEDTIAHRVSDRVGSACLVLLKVSVSPYDRDAYAEADWVAFISSDAPTLTERLLEHVPENVGVVFKVANDADRLVIAKRYATEQKACYLSYTGKGQVERDVDVAVTATPGSAVLDIFEKQGHARSWLQALLDAGEVFVCILGPKDQPQSLCFVFRNYGAVWEIGGVFTAENSRGRGLAGKVVRTALAELAIRSLLSRYQVSADNSASIRVAEKLSMQPFMTLTHHLRSPVESKQT